MTTSKNSTIAHRVGSSTSRVCPKPSCPSLLSPQPNTCPVDMTAKDENDPEKTATACPFDFR